MKKILGYIPLEEGEEVEQVSRETFVMKIENQWFKVAEVWVPGVAVQPKKQREYQPGRHGLCVLCGKPKEEHVLFKVCT